MCDLDVRRPDAAKQSDATRRTKPASVRSTRSRGYSRVEITTARRRLRIFSCRHASYIEIQKIKLERIEYDQPRTTHYGNRCDCPSPSIPLRFCQVPLQ